MVDNQVSVSRESLLCKIVCVQMYKFTLSYHRMGSFLRQKYNVKCYFYYSQAQRLLYLTKFPTIIM